MPKKSRRREAVEAQEIAWFKWEFLRRNHEYQRDYKGLMREFGPWFRKHGYWYDHAVTYAKTEFQFLCTVIAPKFKVICTRWEITDPFPPDWQFTTSGTRQYRPYYEALLPTYPGQSLHGEVWDIAESLSRDVLLKQIKESTKARRSVPDRYLALKIDLAKPLSSQFSFAKDLAVKCKKNYDRAHPQPPEYLPAFRRRLDLYATYLKVWDLRAQGEKWEVIGAQLFPSEPRRAQRALDTFKRAQELIHGGYKELR
jgi:transcriptional regulator